MEQETYRSSGYQSTSMNIEPKDIQQKLVEMAGDALLNAYRADGGTWIWRDLTQTRDPLSSDVALNKLLEYLSEEHLAGYFDELHARACLHNGRIGHAVVRVLRAPAELKRKALEAFVSRLIRRDNTRQAAILEQQEAVADQQEDDLPEETHMPCGTLRLVSLVFRPTVRDRCTILATPYVRYSRVFPKATQLSYGARRQRAAAFKR